MAKRSPGSTGADQAEQVHPTSVSAWRRWLARNASRDKGVWLVTWKKATGKPRMEYAETVEEALAFGWIDSLPRTLDDERSLLWFSPRKPRTGWSRVNKARVARLIADGRMTAAGLDKVVQAKRDGSWSKLDDVEALVIPTDLARALAAHTNAAAHFAAFPRSAKRGILEWIGNAKRTETRVRRVEETARLADKNVRANQWTPKA
ncbi:MAG: YdeI/OmpD-associated family protein [Phycisphaerae bacterium]|nr:YdeI/OmpD-associated family protein [Gemmatimonadaceae bacterium]